MLFESTVWPVVKGERPLLDAILNKGENLSPYP